MVTPGGVLAAPISFVACRCWPVASSCLRGILQCRLALHGHHLVPLIQFPLLPPGNSHLYWSSEEATSALFLGSTSGSTAEMGFTGFLVFFVPVNARGFYCGVARALTLPVRGRAPIDLAQVARLFFIRTQPRSLCGGTDSTGHASGLGLASS